VCVCVRVCMCVCVYVCVSHISSISRSLLPSFPLALPLSCPPSPSFPPPSLLPSLHLPFRYRGSEDSGGSLPQWEIAACNLMSEALRTGGEWMSRCVIQSVEQSHCYNTPDDVIAIPDPTLVYTLSFQLLLIFFCLSSLPLSLFPLPLLPSYPLALPSSIPSSLPSAFPSSFHLYLPLTTLTPSVPLSLSTHGAADSCIRREYFERAAQYAVSTDLKIKAHTTLANFTQR
jgi:hypothetical protein